MIKGFLKYLFGFAVADGGDAAVRAGTAEVDDVIVYGNTKESLTSPDVVIRLSDNQFEAIDAGEEVTTWFTNIPDTLEATVKDDVERYATEITITISGDPDEEYVEEMEITIPANMLTNKTSSILVAANPNAKYDILPGIASMAEFITFATAVNGGDYGLNGRLTSTAPNPLIIPPNASYIPIAQPVAAGSGGGLIFNPYTGTFDGNGHEINFTIASSANFTGLFGFNDGTVKGFSATGNISMTGDPVNGTDYVGVVAYNGIHGHVERIISSVTIAAEDANVHNIGMVGFNGCDKNDPGSIHSPYAGQGYQPGGTIYQCRNEGAIEGGGNKIGGIAGENAGTIQECSNYGDVDCHKPNETHARWPGVGFVGRNGNNNASIEAGVITHCYNRGKLIDRTGQTVDHNAYGFAGWCDKDSKVQSCYTTGEFDQQIEDPEGSGVYISQPLTGSKNPIIGSIDVDVTAMTDDNNFALSTIFMSSDDIILTGHPKSVNEMQSSDFVDIELNKQDPNGPYVYVEGDFPILRWELNYQLPASN